MESGFFISLDIVFYITAFLLLKKGLLLNRRFIGTEAFLGFFLVLLICLFPFWAGDYYHYEEDYFVLLNGGSTNLEPVYTFIVKKLSFSYFSFRLILWGGGFLIVCLLYKKFHLGFGLSLYIFTSVALIQFAYARASVAMALLFLGFSFITTPSKNRVFSLIVGLGFIFSSYFFHESSAFGIAMCIATLFLYNMDAKRLLFLFVLILLSFFLLRGRIEEFMLYNTSGEEALRVVDRAQYYGNMDSSRTGPGALIEMVFARSVFYMTGLIYLLSVFKGQYNDFPQSVKCFSTVSFLIIAFSTLFLFDWGINTYVFYYRFMNFAILPMTVLLAYYYRYNVQRKLVKTTCWLGIASAMYTLLYSFYISFT